jgi:hypothetical protein
MLKRRPDYGPNLRLTNQDLNAVQQPAQLSCLAQPNVQAHKLGLSPAWHVIFGWAEEDDSTVRQPWFCLYSLYLKILAKVPVRCTGINKYLNASINYLC